MKKLFFKIINSQLIQSFATVLLYSFYALLFAVVLMPSVLLVNYSTHLTENSSSLQRAVLTAITYSFSVLLFFFVGVVVIGIILRILTLGIKPGKYSMYSFVMVRWLIYSGLYHLAGTIILSYLPLSFFSRLFFVLYGAKLGKNVLLNTWYLNDAFLLEIGDNVVVGGKTDISCHTFENGLLTLNKIVIGNNSFIGQHCYVSPGVVIGTQCVIGQYVFLRKNTRVPDKTVLTAIAGLPIKTVAAIERGRVAV